MNIKECFDIASHEFVYALGNISHWSLAAEIAISPLMRRLQAINYFSDLTNVLQTTYEQHVQGTSCLMQYYAVSVARMWAKLEEKLLEASYEEETGKRLRLLYDKLYLEYENRIRQVAPLPSLIGMIAAPPYRRPFGTYIKRDYMRTLSRILWQAFENKVLGDAAPNTNKTIDEIINYLSEIKKSFIKLYENIIMAKSVGFLPCIERSLEAIDDTECELARQHNISVKKKFQENSSKIYLKKFKEKYIIEIKNRINEIFYIIDVILNSKSYTSSPSILPHTLLPVFLLRYRTLSTILALAYAYNKALERLKERLEKNPDTIDLEALRECLDALVQLLDAATVNFSSTLLMVSETQEASLLEDNTPKKKIVYLSPLGSPNVILLLPLLSARQMGYREKIKIISKNILNIIGEDPNNPPQGLLQNISDCVKSTILSRKPCLIMSSDSEPAADPSSLFELVRADTKFRLRTREGKTYDHFIIPTTPWRVSIYKEMGVPCCVLTALDKKGECSIEGARETRLLGWHILAALGVEKPQPRAIWSPFLTHLQMNLVQSDMLPSAFQLDLLHRLTKDINAGIRFSPLNISEVLTNIDLYSVTVVATLNAIYNHLFKDPATVARRTGLLAVGDDYLEECPGLRKVDALAAIYFLSLAKEFSYYKHVIEDKISNINNLIKKYNNHEEKEKIKDVWGAIIGGATALTGLLESMSGLLEKLVDETLREKLPQGSRKEAKHCKDPLSKVFNSFHAVSDIGVSTYLGFECTKTRNINSKEKYVYHGIISPLTLYIFLQDEEPVKRNLNYFFNAILILFQTTYSKSLEKTLSKKIEESLYRLSMIRAEVKSLNLLVPTQGIVKTYFHLPIDLHKGPIVIEAISPRALREALQKDNSKVDKRCSLARYALLQNTILRAKGTPSDITKITGRLPATLQDPTLLVMPDQDSWRLSSPQNPEIDNKPLDLDNYTLSAEPKLVYNNSLIYTVILQPREGQPPPPEETVRRAVLEALLYLIKELLTIK